MSSDLASRDALPFFFLSLMIFSSLIGDWKFCDRAICLNADIRMFAGIASVGEHEPRARKEVSSAVYARDSNDLGGHGLRLIPIKCI